LFRQSSSISEDCRIGSNAFVSHAVQLGMRVFVGHGAVINGSVTVGTDSWIGPGAVVSQNVRIGEKACVSLGAVVIRNVAAGARVSGNFAVSHRRLLRMLAGLDSGSDG
jgi:UDP-3-O-[3-hydroxymyristoyl] glucosamine N-acyltransferase